MDGFYKWFIYCHMIEHYSFLSCDLSMILLFPMWFYTIPTFGIQPYILFLCCMWFHTISTPLLSHLILHASFTFTGDSTFSDMVVYYFCICDFTPDIVYTWFDSIPQLSHLIFYSDLILWFPDVIFFFACHFSKFLSLHVIVHIFHM